jgi:cellulose synthase/poly-beta-1,6-N-acetylglucosamine synthase-like glycosyltransferase
VDGAFWIEATFVVLFTPFAIIYPILLFVNRNLEDKPTRPAISDRRVLIAITTDGGAPNIVRKVITRLRTYALAAMDIVVVVEENDAFDYGVTRIAVPADFSPPNGSTSKHRALHYFSTWLGWRGYGSETYVVHLDDDSIVPKRYIEYVLGMDAEAGQGALRLRAIGDHLLSTVADFGRAINCAAYCAFFNERGRPLGVHGEGLVIRADIERELGWDFQPVCAEDLLMGHNIAQHGYRFDYIPGGIYIAPPTSARDFFEQRRRWMVHFYSSLRNIWALSRPTTLWFVWQYSAGGAVIAGLLVWVWILLTGIRTSYALDGGSTLNVAISLLMYQWQASQTGKVRWNLIALVLFIPVAVYVSATSLYFLVVPRSTRNTTIEKV